MNVVIMAGGTGGHIFPGLAVAKALEKRNHKVYWLGAKAGMEEAIVAQSGITMCLLPIQGLRGKGLLNLFKMPFKLAGSMFKARGFFKKNQIDIAISMGGYVSAPGGLACKFCHTQLLVHEQNSIFGMTNRHLSKWAKQVLTGFDLSGKYGSRWVGNPVRSEIESVSYRYRNEAPIHVLILGGSLGANALNTRLPKELIEHIKTGTVSVRHQTGRGHKDVTTKAYQIKSPLLQVTEFIENMAAAYEWADVCICRAGALTVSELAIVGVPALFVPYPHAVDDHQTENAKAVVNADAAFIWQETQSEKELQQCIADLLKAEIRQTKADNMKRLGKSGVAEVIVDICEKEFA